MNFADLFTPAEPLRIVRIIEIPSFKPIEKHKAEEKEVNVSIDIGTKAGFALSALSAPLVPLDQPFIDGQRYAEAGATELATRLDLFVAVPAGAWIRRHGVLLRHSHC